MKLYQNLTLYLCDAKIFVVFPNISKSLGFLIFFYFLTKTRTPDSHLFNSASVSGRFELFMQRKHSRMSKNDIADVTGHPHIPEDARWQNMQHIDVLVNCL